MEGYVYIVAENRNEKTMSDMIDFDFDLFDSTEIEEKKEKKSSRRSVACLELTSKYLYRKAYSEVQLFDVVGSDMKDGQSYHCITGGDVDALSYLKIILRQQNLDYLLFSTWCMAAEDVLQIEEWLIQGKIKKLDAYVGEIFPGSYHIEYQMLKNIMTKYNCGRVCVFKNHSKIFAGYGEKFYFGVETSANINTNPRTENGCITIDKGIYEFYRNYFDGIESFEKDTKNTQAKKMSG